MPSSRCNHIPIVLGIVRQLAPRSILDVGVGFGKWGHLFREYTDIAGAGTGRPLYAHRYTRRVRAPARPSPAEPPSSLTKPSLSACRAVLGRPEPGLFEAQSHVHAENQPDARPNPNVDF